MARKLGLLYAGLGFCLMVAACTSLTEEEILENKKKSALKLAEESQEIYSLGRWDEALEKAEKALEEYPACLEARRVGAECLLALELPDKALAFLLEPPADMAPDPGWKAAVLDHAAQLALCMNQPTLAVIYLNRAIDVTPMNIELYVKRGEVEALAGREKAAEKSFIRALELGGDAQRIVPSLAAVLFELERFEEAEDLLQNRDTLRNLGVKEKLLLGAIQCKLNRVEEGLRLFQEAETLGEDLPEVYFNQGIALEQLGDVPGAKSAYTAALDLDSTYAPACFHLGCLLYKKGDQKEGLDLMDQAIALEPDLLVRRTLEKTRNEWVRKAQGPKDTR